MTSSAQGTFPYGPETAVIRRFFVALAALDLDPHDRVVERFAARSGSGGFAVADATLGEVIERSGRTEARDALFGPLLQLVRDKDAEPQGDVDPEAPVALDPIAEAALAALMALLVRDLIPADVFSTLYDAFADAIPLDSLQG